MMDLWILGMNLFILFYYFFNLVLDFFVVCCFGCGYVDFFAVGGLRIWCWARIQVAVKMQTKGDRTAISLFLSPYNSSSPYYPSSPIM